MKQPLWRPSAERIKNANMTRFIDLVNKRFNINLAGYFDLYDWSINNIAYSDEVGHVL